jgi:hypothetical protein
MVINARNTTAVQIVLTDLAGYAIAGNTSADLTSVFNVHEIAESNVLLLKIASGDIVINNGTVDLDSSTGIRYVSLIFDGMVTNTSSEPVPVTGDVGITGTPSFNINGVTPVDGKLPISSDIQLSSEVTVGNETSNPVPVSVQGTPSVDINGVTLVGGSVPITGDVSITGTPAVDINGVTLDSGKLPVSGTVLVGNETSSPVPVSIENTPNVSVTNTPSVNINNITPSSGTLPVSGTVLVGNETSSPVPISVQGTPNINVTNADSSPVPVNVKNIPSVNIDGVTLSSGTLPVSGNVGIIDNPNVTVSNTSANPASVNVENIPTFNINHVPTTDGTVPVSGTITTLSSYTPTSPYVDVYQRLRVSSPYTLFDTSFSFDLQPRYWDTVTSGTGAAGLATNQDAIEMSVGSLSEAMCVRQSRQYFKFQTGKSTLLMVSGTLGAGVTNVSRKIGIFDADNGFFFELRDSTLYIVQRSTLLGSPIEIPQSAWNMDKLNGTGASGFVLDLTIPQTFIFEIQGLSSGKGRLGINFNGDTIYCHAFDTMTQGTSLLPVRYELLNTGNTSGTTTMMQMRSVITVEGGGDPALSQGVAFSVSSGSSFRSIAQGSGYTTILSIAPKLTYESKTFRGAIYPMLLIANTADKTIEVTAFLNPTLTGAVWSSVNATSAVEMDKVSTSISGGIPLYIAYVQAGAAVPPFDLSKLCSLTLNAAGTSRDVLTLAGRVVSSSAAAAFGSLVWREVY